jgi:ammonium transporter, Amt family
VDPARLHADRARDRRGRGDRHRGRPRGDHPGRRLRESGRRSLAALPSYFAIAWRSRTRIDDSLDVFAGHGIGGLTGALLTGVLAQKVWNSAGNDGLLYGNPAQLGVQALGCLSAALYAGVMTFVILKAMAFVLSLRAVPRIEGVGMDVSQHGEEAYASGEGSILVPPEVAASDEPLPAFTPQVASR